MSWNLDVDSKVVFLTPQTYRRKTAEIYEREKCRSMETLSLVRVDQEETSTEQIKLGALLDEDLFREVSCQQKILLRNLVQNLRETPNEECITRRTSTASSQSNTSDSSQYPNNNLGRITEASTLELGGRYYKILSENSHHFRRAPYYIGWRYIYYPQRKRIEIQIRQKGSVPLMIVQGFASKLSARVSFDNSSEHSVTLVKSRDNSLRTHVLSFRCSEDVRKIDHLPLKLKLYAHESLFTKFRMLTIQGELGKCGQGCWLPLDM